MRRVKGKLNLIGSSGSLIYIHPGGRLSPRIQDVSTWINENIPRGSVLCVGSQFDKSVKVLTKLNYRYEVYYCDYPKFHPIGDFTNPKGFGQDQRIIAVMTTKKVRSVHYRYRTQIFITTDKNLNEWTHSLKARKKYIITYTDTKVAFPFTLKYLARAARKIYSKDGINIYETLLEKTLPPTPGTENIQWSPGTKEDLLWLRDNYPDEFKKYRDILSSRGIALE